MIYGHVRTWQEGPFRGCLTCSCVPLKNGQFKHRAFVLSSGFFLNSKWINCNGSWIWIVISIWKFRSKCLVHISKLTEKMGGKGKLYKGLYLLLGCVNHNKNQWLFILKIHDKFHIIISKLNEKVQKRIYSISSVGDK